MTTDRPDHPVKREFEGTMNVFVATTPDAHLEGLLGALNAYHAFINRNLQHAGPVAPDTFVRWMESADRNPSDYPEPWACELVEQFDDLLISLVRDENQQPADVVEALGEWVEQSKAEVREMHDLPEDSLQ
jgi:hypothetical protein